MFTLWKDSEKGPQYQWMIFHIFISGTYTGPFCLAIEKTGSGSSAQTKAYLESIDAETGRILAIRQTNGSNSGNGGGSGANTTETTSYSTVFFIKDHLGSIRAVVNSQGNILERNAYYPFGLQMNQGKAYPTLTQRLPQLYSGYVSSTPARRDLYNGKELQITAGTDYIDYGFRQYDPVTARWMAVDPMVEKYATNTPYNYCYGNSLSIIDIFGQDTINVTFSDNKWCYSDPIISKGDDVIIVDIDGTKNEYVFSEGEYGKRVISLNLEITDKQALGIYHVSGNSEATGFYLVPGGEASNIKNSNARIEDGTYPIIVPVGKMIPPDKGKDNIIWHQPMVGGRVIDRGVRFHYGKSRKSSEGCFVLMRDYTIGEDGYYYTVGSNDAVKTFNKALGSSRSWVKYLDRRNKTKYGAEYLKPIKHILQLQSR